MSENDLGIDPAVLLDAAEQLEAELEAEKPSTAIALPSTVQGLLDMRKNKSKLNLHDQVEAIHLSLWEDPHYRQYLDAVYSEQAVEGSLMLDDAEAARMIRNYAIKEGNGYVARQKLLTLVRSLGVVQRRYNASRKDRRL